MSTSKYISVSLIVIAANSKQPLDTKLLLVRAGDNRHTFMERSVGDESIISTINQLSTTYSLDWLKHNLVLADVTDSPARPFKFIKIHYYFLTPHTFSSKAEWIYLKDIVSGQVLLGEEDMFILNKVLSRM
jgi:hypothetical protein